MKLNWIFFLGVSVWITVIAAFFELTTSPAFKSLINKIVTQPNLYTGSFAMILMGIVIWYICKGIELGKKEFSD